MFKYLFLFLFNQSINLWFISLKFTFCNAKEVNFEIIQIRIV
jgi:hypothetical protein